MNRFKFLSVTLLAFLLSSSIAFAGDFGWMEDFNMTAAVDPSGFRARLAARFHVGELEIQTVLDNADHPADAYAMFRLGEMSRQPIRHVIEQYKKGKGKGQENKMTPRIPKPRHGSYSRPFLMIATSSQIPRNQVTAQFQKILGQIR